jgi:hypothetical protein
MIRPTVLNLICPQCTKAWLTKGEGHYFCLSCNFVQVERAIREYATSVATDPHKGIYLPRTNYNDQVVE